MFPIKCLGRLDRQNSLDAAISFLSLLLTFQVCCVIARFNLSSLSGNQLNSVVLQKIKNLNLLLMPNNGINIYGKLDCKTYLESSSYNGQKKC